MPSDGDGNSPKAPPAPPRVPTGTSNRPGGPTYAPQPGLQSGESSKAYDEWWLQSGYEVTLWMYANPERADWIKEMSWTYHQDKNRLIDIFMGSGLNPPGPTDTSGGGLRGGGGGGMSKAQQYAQAAAAIKNRASVLGVPLDEGGIVALAKVAVDANWSNDQLDDYLVPAATEAGMVTYGVDQVKKMAAQQLLNVSDATAKEWSQKLASGEMTTEGIQSLLQQQATMKYGWAASQIGQGVSVRDMVLPMRDQLARELEMDSESVDLMDPKWLGMMQTADEKTGEVRVATDSEITMRARKDPMWTQTKAAGNTAAAMATMMRNFFGG